MVPIVCITGCSSGFGQLIALQCAKTCNVIATVRTAKAKAELLDTALKQDLTLDVQLCDVTDVKAIKTLTTLISRTYGHCDVLINNAGVVLGGFFEDYSDQQIKHVLDTNVQGVIAMTKALLPLLRQSKQAKIINLSSIAGLAGIPSLSIYNASKWAIEGFSEALLFELKPFNIDVVLIEPGQYKTALFSKNLHIAKQANSPTSPYYEFSQIAFNKVQKKVQQYLKDPQAIALLCASIIHKKNPRFRYLIGHDARLRSYLKKCLPFELYKHLVQFIYNKTMQKAIKKIV